MASRPRGSRCPLGLRRPLGARHSQGASGLRGARHPLGARGPPGARLRLRGGALSLAQGGGAESAGPGTAPTRGGDGARVRSPVCGYTIVLVFRGWSEMATGSYIRKWRRRRPPGTSDKTGVSDTAMGRWSVVSGDTSGVMVWDGSPGGRASAIVPVGLGIGCSEIMVPHLGKSIPVTKSLRYDGYRDLQRKGVRGADKRTNEQAVGESSCAVRKAVKDCLSTRECRVRELLNGRSTRERLRMLRNVENSTRIGARR